MLKFFVLVIFCAESSCFPLWNSETCKEGEKAEQIFYKEMKSKIDEVADLKIRLAEVKQSLDLRNLFNLRNIITTVLKFFNWFSKAKFVVTTVWNIWQRGEIQSKLKQAEKSLNTELLLQGFPFRGDEVCEQAFEHSYFNKKGWILDREDVDTKSTAPQVITVIDTKHNVSFSRPTKTCKASSGGQTFPVFISAADKFNWRKNFAFFVFISDGVKSQTIAYLVK